MKLKVLSISVLTLLTLISGCGDNKSESSVNGQDSTLYFRQFMSTDDAEVTMENVSNPRDVLYLYTDNFFLHMTDSRGTYRGEWRHESTQLILGDHAMASGVNFNGSNCLSVNTNFENGIFCPRAGF